MNFFRKNATIVKPSYFSKLTNIYHQRFPNKQTKLEKECNEYEKSFTKANLKFFGEYVGIPSAIAYGLSKLANLSAQHTGWAFGFTMLGSIIYIVEYSKSYKTFTDDIADTRIFFADKIQKEKKGKVIIIEPKNKTGLVEYKEIPSDTIRVR
jgi:hypothetical protein